MEKTVKRASIDIGTNSVRLLAAEKRGGEFTPLELKLSIERLGEGLDKTGLLKRAAMERTADRAAEYADLARSLGVADGAIRVFGTAAVREAENREEFLALVTKRSGLAVRVLSGEEEADFTYSGVARHLENLGADEDVLVLDIGGGSTELTAGRGLDRRYSESVKIGSVRLTERCIKTDPPSKEDRAYLMIQTIAGLQPIVNRIKKENVKARLVGVAGSITTFRTITLGMTEYDAAWVQNARMGILEVMAILEALSGKTHAERSKVPGLEAGRADTIIAGGTILLIAMQLLDVDEVTFSDRDGLYGVLFAEEWL